MTGEGTRAGGRLPRDRRRGRATHTGSSHRPRQRRPRRVAVRPGARTPTVPTFISSSPIRYGTESLDELADAIVGAGAVLRSAGVHAGVWPIRSATLWNDFGRARQETAVPASETDRAGPAADARRASTWRRPGTEATAPSTTRPNAARFPALMELPPDGRPATRRDARARRAHVRARRLDRVRSARARAVHCALLRSVRRDDTRAAARGGSPSRRAPAIPISLLTVDGSSASCRRPDTAARSRCSTFVRIARRRPTVTVLDRAGRGLHGPAMVA